LPAKRRFTSCGLGIGAAPGSGRDKGELRKITHANRIRSFAACCGTHLFFEDSKDSDMIDFTIASFDDPTPFAPQKAIFLEDKLPWVVIDRVDSIVPKSPEG
jgi:hypothetical protein